MAKLVNMRGMQVTQPVADGWSNQHLDCLVTLTCCVQVFIADIRNCSNKEQEQLRVDKELGKIRKKFASGNVLSGQLLSLLMVATKQRS